MTFTSNGQFGPEALLDAAGNALVGATVTAPAGYTAAVDARGNLTVTGPPSDSVSLTITPVSGTPVTVAVAVPAKVAELDTVRGLAVAAETPAGAQAKATAAQAAAIAAAPVQSVAGRTGAVVVAKADVGLGNVDNTADTAKPVSTAQSTALGLKLDSSTASATYVAALPTPLEAAKLRCYGHSYLTGVGAQNANGYAARLSVRAATQTASFDNRAVAGVTSAKVVAAQLTAVGLYPTNPGYAILWDATINDVNQAGSGNTAKGLAKYTNAIRYTVLAHRCNAVLAHNAASIAYTAGWTTDGSNDALVPGGIAHGTTTQNDTATITGLTAGSTAAIILCGHDDTLDLSGGATYSITTSSDSVGVSVVATGTASNQFLQGNDTAPRGALPVIITVPTGTNPVVVVKKTDANGTRLHLAQVLTDIIPAGQGPLMIFMKQQPVSGYANGASDTTLAQFTSALSTTLTVLGGVGNDLVIADPGALGWTKTTHVSTDALHPNELGHQVLWKSCLIAASTVVPAKGHGGGY